jgi:Ca2+-transporting ATPase
MNRPPQPPRENLFARGLTARILITAVILAGASIFIQWWALQKGYDQRTQQSAVFSVLCFVQLANAIIVRSIYEPLISKSFFSNSAMWLAIALTIILQVLIISIPILQKVFKTTLLPRDVIVVGLVLIFASIVLLETLKFFAKRRFLRPIIKA